MPDSGPPPGTPLARIDLDALEHNWHQVRRAVGATVDVLAMVKADAYGHGAVAVSRRLLAAGCRRFGVATLAEAAEVGPVVGDSRVTVVGGLVPAAAATAAELGVEIVTQEIDVIRAFGARASALGRELAVHIKVDTGMTRLGVAPEDAPALVEAASAVAGVRVVAICSHFALAESVTGEVTAGQLERLLGVDAVLRERGIALERHLANSAGILTRPASHLDCVRPGLMLYGLYPDPSLARRAELRPVMTLTAPVVRVAEVAAGRGVSYGHTFRTERPTRVATLRLGYGDGYPRHLSNLGQALVRGRLVPVIGRVCMDNTMVDVTDVDAPELGEYVTLWGPEPATETMAERAGTIAYELVVRVGSRVPRVYEGAGAAGDDAEDRGE
jgi:alanine racemase